MPKADKMELIIQKCVELGVERIVAVSTERAIVKLDKKEGKKLERWQKIAEAAAKAERQRKIPEIGGQVLKFKDAVAEAKAGWRDYPLCSGRKDGLREFVQSFEREHRRFHRAGGRLCLRKKSHWRRKTALRQSPLGNASCGRKTAMTTTAILFI